VASASATLSARLSGWDVNHYLTLSKVGYQKDSPSCAFYPLWPAIIHLATFMTFGHALLASLVLANALSLVAFWLFYRLVEQNYGPVLARDALILMVAFPGALFFSIPYTESLFLVLVLIFFHGLRSERYLVSCVAVFLMPLAKAVGVFVVLPLAWHLYERRKHWKHGLMLLVPLAGYATYFGIMRASTGNPFEGFDAQRSYPNSPSIRNIFDLAGFTTAFLNVNSLDGMMDSALDRGFFIMLLILLPLIFRLNKTWFFYVLAAGVVPAASSWFMSYRRYIMICFPVFIILAQGLQRLKSRWLFWYYVLMLVALQIWAVIHFANGAWAG
jgi:hypothetical protein